MSEAAIITSKGQVTLPKGIRAILGSRVVQFEATAAGILIKPVNSVAGSLSAFARGESEDFTAVRDAVWTEVADEKERLRPA